MIAARQSRARPVHGFGETLIHSVLDAVGDAACVKDLDGRYLLCNEAFADIVDHRAEEVEGKLDWDLFPPDVALLLQDRQRAALATGERTTCEFALERPSGTRRYLQTMVPLLGPRGATAGSVGITRDVTASHQERLSMELREQQLADAQMLARLGSWEWDIESDRVAWSDEMYEMIGIVPQSQPPTCAIYLDHVHPGDRERTGDILEHAVRTGAPFEFEHRLVRSDGTEIMVLCRGLVTRDDKEAPIRIFGTNQDITAHRDAERSLREAMAQAGRANAAKSEFLSKMSHELRTPLNAILGFGQVMAADPELRDKEGVEQILSAGHHLLSLIDEILDLSTIESGRIEVSADTVALHEVARESVDLIRPVAEQRAISIRIAAGLEAGRFVQGDARRLKQVLLNLLSNAVKYNHENGSVSLDCRELPENVLRIQVRDTGPGLTPDQISALFEPFNRLGAERTGTEGTGLGLALSKGLVEAMGGRMGADSRLGRGSTFWVELPSTERPACMPAAASRGAKASPATAAGTIPHRSADSAPDSTGRRLLYIEDNPANLRLLQRLLSRRGGLEMLCAETAADGLRVANEARPDLILLDVQLPDMNGDEVLWKLQQDPELRNIPVVAISGDATQHQIRRLLDLGAREYHTKPLDLSRLLDTIDSVLRSGAHVESDAA